MLVSTIEEDVAGDHASDSDAPVVGARASGDVSLRGHDQSCSGIDRLSIMRAPPCKRYSRGRSITVRAPHSAMHKLVLAIARFTLLEATRTRLPWVVLGVIALGLGLAEFAASLALTDSAAYRADGYAAWTRLALVAVIALHVATSVAREFEARLLDLTLSRPLSRLHWYLGRLLGFGVTAAVVAAGAALPLALTSAPLAASLWGLSLAAELGLVAAATLAASVALGQVTPAVLAVAGFYLLSRAMSAIVLMSNGPLVDATAWSTWWMAHTVRTLALLLPALDRFTMSAWLYDAGAAAASLPAIGAQTVIYSVLLVAVGLFDFVRRDV